MFYKPFIRGPVSQSGLLSREHTSGSVALEYILVSLFAASAAVAAMALVKTNLTEKVEQLQEQLNANDWLGE